MLIGGPWDGSRIDLTSLPQKILKQGFVRIETLYEKTDTMLEGRWVYREVPE